MAVKKFYSTKAKAGWKFDAKKEKFWSYGYDIYLESGRRKRESGFGTKDLATSAAARIKLGEKNKLYELTDYRKFPTCAELFQKRIENAPLQGEKSRSRRVLQNILDLLPEDLRINDLTVSHINTYISARQKENVKDETINRDLRTVRATLNQAKTFFPHLEKFEPPKFRFIKAEKTRRERIVSSVEIKAILLYLMKPQSDKESEKIYLSRRRAGLLFLLSAVTGARPGELVALKASDVLEDLQVLKITGKKTRFKTAKTIRYFPLLPVVKKILAEAVAIQSGELIFTQNATLTKTYYGQIKAACASCGIVYGRKAVDGLIPYDLRHTATTLIMHSGADFETVASITGQSRHTLWHYTHANNESISRAVAVLETFADASTGNNFDGLSLDTKENPKLLNAANSAS
jgi:integrase